jgi:hypothetical protein
MLPALTVSHTGDPDPEHTVPFPPFVGGLVKNHWIWYNSGAADTPFWHVAQISRIFPKGTRVDLRWPIPVGTFATQNCIELCDNRISNKTVDWMTTELTPFPYVEASKMDQTIDDEKANGVKYAKQFKKDEWVWYWETETPRRGRMAKIVELKDGQVTLWWPSPEQAAEEEPTDSALKIDKLGWKVVPGLLFEPANYGSGWDN